ASPTRAASRSSWSAWTARASPVRRSPGTRHSPPPGTSAPRTCSIRPPMAPPCRATKHSASSGASTASSRCSWADTPSWSTARSSAASGCPAATANRTRPAASPRCRRCATCCRARPKSWSRPTSRNNAAARQETDTAHRVLWLQSQQQFDVADGETILAAASRQGVELPHECTFGGCGTCRIQVLQGRVDYEELPLALSEEEHAQGQGLACQARALSDLVISVERPAGYSEPTLVDAEVAELRLLSPDIYHLQLQLPADHGIVYRPGQYLNIHLDDAGHRSFSMANPPDAGRVDLQIRRIAGGYFTDR